MAPAYPAASAYIIAHPVCIIDPGTRGQGTEAREEEPGEIVTIQKKVNEAVRNSR